MKYWLVILFIQSCGFINAQDWVFKKGQPNGYTYTLKNYLVEWNHCYIVGNYSNKMSFDLTIVDNKTRLLKTINFKSKDYKNITLWGISIVDKHLLVYGNVENPSLTDYIERGFFFELDSCFEVKDFTILAPTNPKDSFSRIIGILDYKFNKKTILYLTLDKQLGPFNGLLLFENDQQVAQFYIQNYIEWVYKQDDIIYFAGSNYITIPFVNQNIRKLKGYWGHCDSSLKDIKYIHYLRNDSTNYSEAVIINKLSGEDKSVVSIFDRSYSTNPDILGVGNLAIINNSTNKIERELKYFTDTSITECPYSQLITTNNEIITFTSIGNGPIYYPGFVYVHDKFLNLIKKSPIANSLGKGYLFSMWDSDSNIIVYTYYLNKNNGQPNTLVMKFDKDLTPINIDQTLPDYPLCDTIPDYILLENNKSLEVNFDTSYVLKINPASSAKVADLLTNGFILYPNPSHDRLNIRPNNLFDIKHIIIYNSQGRKVKDIDLNELNDKLVLDIADLPDGNYIIQIITDKSIINEKLIIAR